MNLFCFALEDSLYCYTRAPMGYTGSSHYFIRLIQKILEDIPGTHVEVDDLLTEAPTMDEALALFKKVLVRCPEKNIKLARFKQSFAQRWTLQGPI